MPVYNAQKWLDENFPKEKRENFLSINFRKSMPNPLLTNDLPLRILLSGELDLREFINLEGLSCCNNQLTNLDLSNCVNLNRLDCQFNKLTSLDASHNSKLTDIHCDYSLLPNITGLENTSIIRLDVRGGISQGEIANPQKIWKILTDIRKKHFPEMALIDISDLDRLAAQVNEQTSNDPEFLTQLCPLESETFIERYKGDFYWTCDQLANRILARVLILQNRLYEGKDEQWEKEINDWSSKFLKCCEMNPKNPAAAYIPTRQELCDKLCGLNAEQADPELVERVKDLPWLNESAIKREFTNSELKDPIVEKPLLTENFATDETSEASEISISHNSEPTSPNNDQDWTPNNTFPPFTPEKLKISFEPPKPKASCKDEQCKNYKVNCPGLCPECYQKPSTKPKIDIFSSQSTQPPPIPIFTTPTSEQRKTSQNKKHQEVRAAQLATAEVKKRERQNQINQTPINPPPITPTPPILPQTPNSNSQNSSGNSNHRHQKSFFCKTREFFINETTAKIAKWTAIGTGAIAGTGVLYVGLACWKGLCILKGAAAAKITASACFWAGASAAFWPVLIIVGVIAAAIVAYKVYQDWQNSLPKKTLDAERNFARKIGEKTRELAESFSAEKNWELETKNDLADAAEFTGKWGTHLIVIFVVCFLYTCLKKFFDLWQ